MIAISKGFNIKERSFYASLHARSISNECENERVPSPQRELQDLTNLLNDNMK